MAKTQTKPRRSRSFLSWLARHKVTAVFSVLIVAGVLFWGISTIVWNIQIHSERTQFQAAQNSLENLYTQITRNVGSSDFTSTKESCSYTHVEVGQGARSCDVDKFFTYNGLDSEEAAQQKVINLEQIINSSNAIHTYRKLSLGYLSSSDGAVLVASDRFMTIKSSLSCGGDYYWVTDPAGLPEAFPISSLSPNTLVVRFNCSGSAKSEYFPVVND